MALNLSPADQFEYRTRVEAHEKGKQAAIREGDKEGARRLRQAIGRLYDEYAARQLPPDPPEAWEIERALTIEQRVARIEVVVCKLLDAPTMADYEQARAECREMLAEVYR